MDSSLIFYFCPICFYSSETPDDSHEHTLLRVDPGLPGDERRKPVTDPYGHILSPAPRWFYEAILQAPRDGLKQKTIFGLERRENQGAK